MKYLADAHLAVNLAVRAEDGSLQGAFIAEDHRKQSARNKASLEALRFLGVDVEALN